MNDSATAPITTPQMLPRPPRMIMARMKIEKPNWNWLAFTELKYDAEEGAGHTAERPAGGVGQQLGPHERHAHAGGRHLVLAHGDPGAAEPRVAQAEVHEQHQRHHAEGQPVVRSQVEAESNWLDEREVDLVHRGDRLAAVGERVVAERDVVAVQGEHAG